MAKRNELKNGGQGDQGGEAKKVESSGTIPNLSHETIRNPKEILAYDGHPLQVVTPGGVFPGIEQLRCHGFTSSSAHFHKGFDESYLIEQGTLVLALWDARNPPLFAETMTLKEGDFKLIPRWIGHKVLDGSPTNSVLITYSPLRDPLDFHAVSEIDEKFRSYVRQSYEVVYDLSKYDLLLNEFVRAGPQAMRAKLAAMLLDWKGSDDYRSYLAMRDTSGW